MTLSFHRRSSGYSQASVEYAFAHLHADHAAEVERLEMELAQARTRTNVVNARLAALEGSLREATERLQSLVEQAVKHLTEGPRALQAAGERSALAEAELEGEISRLNGMLAELRGLQHRLGADIGSVTRRYRQSAAAMRHAVPGQKESVGP